MFWFFLRGKKVFIPLSLVHPVLQFMQEIQLRRCANIQPNVLVSRLKMLPPPGPLRTPSYQAPLIGLRFLTSAKYRCHWGAGKSLFTSLLRNKKLVNSYFIKFTEVAHWCLPRLKEMSDGKREGCFLGIPAFFLFKRTGATHETLFVSFFSKKGWCG